MTLPPVMTAAFRTLCLATALAALLAPPASADEPERPPPKTAKREADRHFKTGVRLFDEGKYSEALAEFEQAYALESHPLVLYNLAAAHRALSQYAQAVEFYNRFLVEGKGVVRARQLARGERELAEVLRLIAKIDVTTTPEGAVVSVDGREVGPSPLDQPLILGPGDHVVSAMLAGHEPAERAIRVAAGDTLAVALSLARRTEVRPPEVRSVETEPDTEPAAVITRPPPGRHFTISASFATNAIESDSTGAPVIGIAYTFGDRVSLGVEAVLVAYSAVPELRVRLFGDGLSLHLIAAAPISFTDGEDSDPFVAGAGGLGLRYRAHDRFSLRAEAWVSYAGSERGTTIPAMAGAELWF
ncbi:MAG TPA: PEGA domain-containing protein [Candidatus Acidoferrum sp.]|nr:PEGA domain-containing protein [Candidatus Acidoferrum sp.]